ncbi:antibiotic biosynthesis regulator FhaA [Kitasatospora nipponensis]|uniref:Antibiotic biosynthesis regulator FhaA n=1 Tax=Kitasatospora nipponensis TaxID=258049 RepID=A0ABP4HI20_9ACTN
MGVLKKFEQRLEGLVNGTFAKVFKSEVQPVEIAGALQRECDNNATIWNRERTVVPNDFIVELSPHDYERLSPYAGQLGQELAGMVLEYAEAQRYSFLGPLQVNLEQADDLDTGLYRVRSRTLASDLPEQQQPAAPGGYGRGPAAEAPGAPWQQNGAPTYGGAPTPPSAPPVTPPAPAGAGMGNVRPFPGSGSGAGTRRWIEVNGARHQITGTACVLGRSTEADVRIDDPGVSRKHAEIRPGTPAMVLDLGSTNGIVVDGQHTQRATLRDGSRIVVGSTTIIYRQVEG